MTLGYVPVDGPPEAVVCPVLLCDHCNGLIDADRVGIVLWAAQSTVTRTVAHVHKGACDNAFEASRPDEQWLWEELGDWLAQLMSNTQRPSNRIRQALSERVRDAPDDRP